MDIVQNILKIKEAHHMTDQQLVKILNTNTSKIYDWKKGKSRPSAEDISKLAEHFGVSADYLMGRSDDPHPESGLEEDEEIILINRAAKKASPEQRKKMAKLLKAGFEDLFEDEDV